MLELAEFLQTGKYYEFFLNEVGRGYSLKRITVYRCFKKGLKRFNYLKLDIL